MVPLDFIQQNIFLVAVVLGSLIAFLILSLKPRAGKMVSAGQAIFLMNRENAHCIDVRSINEFQNAHIPHAQNIPLDSFATRIDSLKAYAKEPLIVYCASGIRSEKALALLKRAGFEKLYHLEGGFDSWVSAHYPTQKAKK